MLYHLLPPLTPWLSVLNVTRYITFRTAVASMTALALGLVLGPWMIRKLREFQIGQIIRHEGPATHRTKAGTPTMGGLLILTATLVPTLLWADLANPFIWIAVLATIAFGAIGFADDYLKIVRHSHHGLLPRYKLFWQFVVGLSVGAALMLLAMQHPPLFNSQLIFPFFKRLVPALGLAYVAFAALVLTFSTNAVNLTDGLDGLAISVFAVAAATFTALAYVSTHAVFASYLQLTPVPPAASELTIFCGLGGALGTVALLIKQEALLAIVGGVFVMEAMSVIIQVASFKTTGKRVFRMAPIHHHFELIGWSEPKVITRFLILAIIFALFSLTTLKLR